MDETILFISVATSIIHCLASKKIITTYNITGEEFAITTIIPTAIFSLFLLSISEINSFKNDSAVFAIFVTGFAIVIEVINMGKMLKEISPFKAKIGVTLSVILSYFINITVNNQSFSFIKLLLTPFIITGVFLVLLSGNSKNKKLKGKKKLKSVFLPMTMYCLSISIKNAVLSSPNMAQDRKVVVYEAFIVAWFIIIIGWCLKSSKETNLLKKMFRSSRKKCSYKKYLLILIVQGVLSVLYAISVFFENSLIQNSSKDKVFSLPLSLIVLFLFDTINDEKTVYKKLIGGITAILAILIFQAI